MAKEYKHQGETFLLDDSKGCYVKITYKDQVGYLGVNLQGSAESRIAGGTMEIDLLLQTVCALATLTDATCVPCAVVCYGGINRLKLTRSSIRKRYAIRCTSS